MCNLERLISLFVGDRKGATAIEYAMLASGIGVAIAVGVGLVGTDLNVLYTSFGTLF